MYAARDARTEVVKLLVDSKVDVNLQNKVSPLVVLLSLCTRT
jgi:hypothetical protein